MIAKRAESLNPSITLSITAKAKAMKAAGLDVIGYGAGEPDFDTPQQIKDAAVAAINKGMTKYTPSVGTPVLREEICRKFKKDNDLEYKPEQIIVGSGAKYNLFTVIASLVEKGDEVVIPSPYWVSYPEMVNFAEGKNVFVDTVDNNFKLTAEMLESSITDRTKMVILNYPSNPTGWSYTKEELKELADVIVKKNILCLSDEIYEKLVYDGVKHVSIASLYEDIKQRTIVVNGVSKSYSMTGWRIGYAAGPIDIIKKVKMVHDHSTSNACSIAQAAALEGIRLDNNDDPGFKKVLDNMTASFAQRRDAMVDRVNRISGLKCARPQGAFYCFVDISGVLGKKCDGKVLKGSLEFCDMLLEKKNVAAVPGVAFGADSFIRLSYAMAESDLLRGLDRVEDFIKELK